MKTPKTLFAILFIIITQNCSSQSGFKKTVLTRDFLAEGVAAADLNKDGRQDIIAGYYWFEAPNWVKHEMAPSRTFNPRKEYSEAFMNFAMDVNLDGWEDVVVIDYPGKPAFWFENNKNNEGIWNKHIIADSIGLGNESPGFIDLDGDGRLDILCADVKTKQIVWLKSPTKKGEIKWKRYALSEKNVPGTDRYSHGIGWGDVNMDGINDVVIPEGWFEGKKNLKSGGWPFHLANLGEPCSHMQVIDLNGDGKNDVISTSAHKLGMWWHEQIFKDGKIDFITHTFSTTTLQTHATIMADLDGNGKKELITGKRYLAHNGNDKGDSDAPMLLYYNINKGKTPLFVEHIIDEDSGIGLNIVIKDMNNDRKPDIIIANKNGVFLFENNLKK